MGKIPKEATPLEGTVTWNLKKGPLESHQFQGPNRRTSRVELIQQPTGTRVITCFQLSIIIEIYWTGMHDSRNIGWVCFSHSGYSLWTLIHYFLKIGTDDSAPCVEYPLNECPIYAQLDWHFPVQTGLLLGFGAVAPLPFLKEAMDIVFLHSRFFKQGILSSRRIRAVMKLLLDQIAGWFNFVASNFCMLMYLCQMVQMKSSESISIRAEWGHLSTDFQGHVFFLRHGVKSSYTDSSSLGWAPTSGWPLPLLDRHSW